MRIVIVGGGSAGWITAATLSAALNRNGRRGADISLIESAEIGRIGVGEATVPTLLRFLQRVGIDEAEFLRASDATYKQAIRFEGWQDAGSSYFHPFNREQGDGLATAGIEWLQSDRSVPFAQLVSPQISLMDAGRGPRVAFGERPFTYAFHMDAEKFADFLAERCQKDGVQRIVGTVQKVETFPNGMIASLSLADGARIEGDFFVDCTGFRRLLIGKVMHARLRDASEVLICDRAVAMRVPYKARKPKALAPFTTAAAREAGWMWDIPLQNRRGRGYVYSSAHLDDAEAETALRRDEGDHAATLDVRHLRFQVGRLETPWIGNCAAIGLSQGFIEPLESTGLHLVTSAADWLADHLPLAGFSPALEERWNTLVNDAFDEALDFVSLHYVLSKRRDTPFWRDAARQDRATDRLRQRLSLWEVKPPTHHDFTSTLQLFSHLNYEFILFGMGWAPDMMAAPPIGAVPATPGKRVRGLAEKYEAILPSHRELVAAMVAGPGANVARA